MEINGEEITHEKVHTLKDSFIYGGIRYHKLNDECCLTCKRCNMKTGICSKLLSDQRDNYGFVCDFYLRRRSGAYRKKRAKENKNAADNRRS